MLQKKQLKVTLNLDNKMEIQTESLKHMQNEKKGHGNNSSINISKKNRKKKKERKDRVEGKQHAKDKESSLVESMTQETTKKKFLTIHSFYRTT